jgi:hypothetical protein
VALLSAKGHIKHYDYRARLQCRYTASPLPACPFITIERGCDSAHAHTARACLSRRISISTPSSHAWKVNQEPTYQPRLSLNIGSARYGIGFSYGRIEKKARLVT